MIDQFNNKKGKINHFDMQYLKYPSHSMKNLRRLINWDKLVKNETKKYGKEQWNTDIMSTREMTKFEELWLCSIIVPKTQEK